MNRKDLERWILANGWIRDSWGHYIDIRVFGVTSPFRLTLQEKSVKFEARYGIDWRILLISTYEKCSVIDNTLKIDGKLI